MSWLGLNKKLRTASEQQCWEMLRDEAKGAHRLCYLQRIHSRANRLRAERERKELATLVIK